MKKIVSIFLLCFLLIGLVGCTKSTPDPKTAMPSGEYYILELELSQTHITLDVGQWLKDSVNTVTMEIMVDKFFYDQQEVGTELLREFRSGSLLMYGSIGDWVVTVTDKKILKIE